MKIAIVHDWLYTYAGAEKVLEQIIACFPEADLYSLIDFIPKAERGFLLHKPVTTSFIQHLPWARTKHRYYLPLMPLAIEQFDLSAYELIISSSHAVAKGVLSGPQQLHICYCHSPIRYAWDMQHQYLREANLSRGLKSWLTRYMLHKVRLWDYRTANGVDYFLANSRFIAQRIFKVYRREAEVIYPPVAVDKFAVGATRSGDFYLTASRLVPYKKIPLIAEAFSLMPERRLKIVGIGPEQDKIIKLTRQFPNLEYLAYQDDRSLQQLMQQACAFVFAAEEDFGIIPVEAQACGTPVIAFARGGAVETVQANVTGVFFAQQTPAAIVEAVARFENEGNFKPANCRANAEQFSVENFQNLFRQFVTAKYHQFIRGKLE